MNRWYVAGYANSFYVEFKKDGQFVQPDPASIKLTIRDNSGLPISGYDHAAQPDTLNTTLLLTIPQAVNVVNEGRENRYVRLEFTSAGVPCAFVAAYKLTPFIPIAVVPEDVRNILGARDTELKDQEIDLYEAYFRLARDNPLLEDALTDTGDKNMYANRAIALAAALILIPSMPVRAIKEDTLNNASAIRATVDWDKVQAGIESELAQALANVAADIAVSFAYSPIFRLSTPIDPITNA